MKQNKMMRIASVLLVVVLLSTCAISGTFAKYVSTIEGSDSARVAKWDFQVEDVTAKFSNSFTFELFKTIQDSNLGAGETDISPADGSIIAPGTSGKFQIDLKNASEVTAEYDIAYSMTNVKGIPVQFSLDGANWKANISDLDTTSSTRLEIGSSTSVIVYWRWVFGGDDNIDTALGLDGDAEIFVTATVTATQVD